MGLSNAFANAAVGVALRVNPFKQAKNRVDLGDARAIQVAFASKLHALPDEAASSVEAQQASRGHKQKATTDLEHGHYGPTHKWPFRKFGYTAMCVYSLDKMSQMALDTVPAAQRGEPISIHTFMPDIDGIVPAWKDWAVLLSSLVKITEALCLWKLGSHQLWYWTMVAWSHAFVSSVILQLFRLGRDNPLTPASDIISGILPTPLHLGGKGKTCPRDAWECSEASALEDPTGFGGHLQRCWDLWDFYFHEQSTLCCHLRMDRLSDILVDRSNCCFLPCGRGCGNSPRCGHRQIVG